MNKARIEEIERQFYDYAVKGRGGPQFTMDDFRTIRELTDFAFKTLAARPEVDARERLLNQIIELCERLDDCSAGYAGERIRDDFLIGRKDEAHPSPQKPRDPNALKNRKQPCTCTGSCRGPEGLGEGWVCGLTLPQ